jgi:hypothetical protein
MQPAGASLLDSEFIGGECMSFGVIPQITELGISRFLGGVDERFLSLAAVHPFTRLGMFGLDTVFGFHRLGVEPGMFAVFHNSSGYNKKNIDHGCLDITLFCQSN